MQIVIYSDRKHTRGCIEMGDWGGAKGRDYQGMKNLRNNGYVYYFRVDIFTVINNKIYQILHFQYTVYCELYFSKAVFNVEIKTTQMRMGKGHLFRAYGRHSKADRPVGSFVIEKGRYVLV